jgi:1,4-alpha-glucan branching enzyme
MKMLRYVDTGRGKTELRLLFQGFPMIEKEGGTMVQKRKETQAEAEPKKAKPKANAQKTETAATKKRAAFKLDASEARGVFLAGSFNEWNPSDRALKRDKKGVWTTTMMLAPGAYEYRFVVDGEWRDDPKAAERRANEHGTQNCVIYIAE